MRKRGMLGPIETYLYIQSKVRVAFASSGVCHTHSWDTEGMQQTRRTSNQNYFFPTPVLFTDKHKFVLENLNLKWAFESCLQ